MAHIKHADTERLIHAATIGTGSYRSNNNNGNTITRWKPVELDPDALYMHGCTLSVKSSRSADFHVRCSRDYCSYTILNVLAISFHDI